MDCKSSQFEWCSRELFCSSVLVGDQLSVLKGFWNPFPDHCCENSDAKFPLPPWGVPWIRNSSSYRQSKQNIAEERPISCWGTMLDRTSLIDTCEESFSRLGASLHKYGGWSDINKPTLPWCRKVPKGFEPRNTPPEFPTSIGSSNLVVNCVKNHFKQPGYQLYHHLEDVLLKCMHGDKSYQEDIEFISKFYSGDLENSSLSTHLETFTMLVRNNHWSR